MVCGTKQVIVLVLSLTIHFRSQNISLPYLHNKSLAKTD